MGQRGESTLSMTPVTCYSNNLLCVCVCVCVYVCRAVANVGADQAHEAGQGRSLGKGRHFSRVHAQ